MFENIHHEINLPKETAGISTTGTNWPTIPAPYYEPLKEVHHYYPDTYQTINYDKITRQEFEELKKELKEIKALLLKNADMKDKLEFLKKAAELVGVDLEKAFK